MGCESGVLNVARCVEWEGRDGRRGAAVRIAL